VAGGNLLNVLVVVRDPAPWPDGARHTAPGQRAEAVAYLKTELATWSRSPIASRIQKNLNLLTLEGKPSPALDVSHFLGARPLSLAALKGHPVLLFFWAH